MAISPSDQLAAALCDFAARIDLFDPLPGPYVAELRVGGQAIALREPVVRALAGALRQYQDPRDRGPCDHCGGPRLDDNFVCADCGRPSGVFGRLLQERAARFDTPAELPD